MKRAVVAFVGIAVLGGLALGMLFLQHQNMPHLFPVLFPSGSIGLAERDLMLHTLFLMLIVVVPVFLLIIFVAWHYRARNHKATYTPNWEQSTMEEFIWWSIPFEIVLVLGALTWTATHELDPYRALSGKQAPLVVEVVALPWQWLFIYPEQGVASVNELVLPTDRPVTFHITADAPMNSFWIPALGGQMYAMSGMVTQLNLDAPKPGVYEGRSANYSGEGFPGMTFSTRALTQNEFATWLEDAKNSDTSLSSTTYNALTRPGVRVSARYYNAIAYPFEKIVAGSMGMNEDSPGNAMQMNMSHH